jgi:hypothetical protein
MMLEFDTTNIKLTEFGVGRDVGNGRTYVYVPVDADVQTALREMVAATWRTMQSFGDDSHQYDPSEKHASTEYVYLPLDDDLGSALKAVHEAVNLIPDTTALENPETVFCYFARLSDKTGRRLTALRRATQFKGVLKNRLIQLMSDSLKIIKDKVFKLDADFDLLIDNSNIHILRPSGFEFVGQVKSAVLDAVPKNIHLIQKDLPFVDFDMIASYAAKHPRAARYLASIRGQRECKNIDKDALKQLCARTRVSFTESD